MSFVRYSTDDSVVSSEIVVRGLWTGDTNILQSFYSSSAQPAVTLPYYLDVYNTSAVNNLQFDIEYAHISGSGSAAINPNVPDYTPTKVIYGKYRNLIYGSEDVDFKIGGTIVQDFYVINVARARYKESIKVGSLALSLGGVSGSITLTDDSQVATQSNFVDSNRYYNIVSGSEGTVVSSATIYGQLYPDLGLVILDPDKLSGYLVAPATGSSATNNANLFDSIKTGSNFRLQSQETISSRYFFTRIKNGEFNYTTNPSIIDSKGNLLYATLIDNPQTYVTTIGLYNDRNELLAVAKLSKPLVKDFTKESLIRVKLDY
jgi:hypothetical protein